MKINELKKAISRLKIGRSSRQSIINGILRLSVSNNVLSIRSIVDEELMTEVFMPCRSPEFTAYVSATLLKKHLDTSPAATDVAIGFVGEHFCLFDGDGIISWLSINCNDNLFVNKWASDGVERHPLQLASLKPAIELSDFVSIEDTRLALHHIFYDKDRFKATDGHALGQIVVGDIPHLDGIMIKPVALKALMKLAAKQTECQMSFHNDQVTFIGADFTLTCADGRRMGYPSYDRVIPTHYGPSLKLDVSAVKECPRPKAHVVLKVTKDTVKLLQYKTDDAPAWSTEYPQDNELDYLWMGFQYKLLLQCMKFVGEDPVTLKFTYHDPIAEYSVAMESADASRFALLMPIRLPEEEAAS